MDIENPNYAVESETIFVFIASWTQEYKTSSFKCANEWSTKKNTSNNFGKMDFPAFLSFTLRNSFSLLLFLSFSLSLSACACKCHHILQQSSIQSFHRLLKLRGESLFIMGFGSTIASGFRLKTNWIWSEREKKKGNKKTKAKNCMVYFNHFGKMKAGTESTASGFKRV